jgi:NAD(P)H-flavin reductase
MTKTNQVEIRENPMIVEPFLVRRRTKETIDTFSMELEVPTANGGFQFTPGQFNMMYAYGIGEVPISISGDSTKENTLVHTVRAVGAVTRALCRLKAGDSLGIRGPYGTGWPVEKGVGRDVIIVTGGIGLAPLRPVIYHLLHHRKEYGRIVLLYGARTPGDILYHRDLEKWRSRFDIEVYITVDRGTGEWRGNVGVVTSQIQRALFEPSNSISMVCGPEIMMRYAVVELMNKGLGEETIYVSMERNMKCGIGLCGHCQLGPTFVCKDGPVYCYRNVKDVFQKREL